MTLWTDFQVSLRYSPGGEGSRHGIIWRIWNSAVAIQANFRRYLAQQMAYQFDIIDVIIVQSIARRWKTQRVLSSVRLQCFARCCIAKSRFSKKLAMHTLVVRHKSATKIQARWRSHTAQMNLLEYIAATRIQAQFRSFIAREQRSAMKIQSVWRSYSAQVHMLISIVNVIVIQVSLLVRSFC